MKKEIHLIYEGDAWLSTDSLVLMGLYEDFDQAKDAIINEMAESGSFDEENGNDEEDVRSMLDNYRQTQGLETNYLIETAALNTWGEI